MRNIACLHWRPFCCCWFGKQQKYTFNSSVKFEIVSKMFEMFQDINKSNFTAKYPKENANKTL